MRFGGIVLVTALVVGACSSDPAPKEPEPTTPTTTATPAVTVPSMPTQASEDSPEGAAAFVKYYVDVFNYAAATGDVEELTRLSSPDCEGCQSYIKLYKETYEAGGYFRGGDWKIGDLEVAPDTMANYLTTLVTVEPGTFKENAQDTESRDAGEQAKVSFAVEKNSGSWRTLQLGLGEVQ